MGKQPTHRICLAEDYTDKEGSERTAWTNVGSAWASEGGTLTCEPREGIALTGRFVLVLNKDATPDT